MSSINCTRRYYLLKRLYATRADDDSAGVWRRKQESIAGASLPSDFPLLERLAAAGYATLEDLNGADERELRVSGFSSVEATTILAALAPLI